MTVGTRIVSPFVKRKKKRGSQSLISAEQVSASAVSAAQESLGTIPHANAPAPEPVPTPKSAISAPKEKVTLETIMASALGPERTTTVGKVVRR